MKTITPTPQYDALYGDDPNPSARVLWRSTNGARFYPYVDAQRCDSIFIRRGEMDVNVGLSYILAEDLRILMAIAISHQLLSAVTLKKIVDDKGSIYTISSCLRDIPLEGIFGDISCQKEFLRAQRSQPIEKLSLYVEDLDDLKEILTLEGTRAVDQFTFRYSHRFMDASKRPTFIGNCTRLLAEMIDHPIRMKYEIAMDDEPSKDLYVNDMVRSLVGNTFYITHASIFFYFYYGVATNECVTFRDAESNQRDLSIVRSRREWSIGYDYDLHKYLPQKTKYVIEALEAATSTASSQLPSELMALIAGALAMSSER
jgi:hypothetical protein